MSRATPKSRRRRFAIGLCVTAATLAALAVALEIAVRCLVPAEVFSAHKPIHRAAPEVGYTLLPGFDGDAFGAPLRTNTLGFRGPEWSPGKAPGTARIVWIGDSHAFGFGVRETDGVAQVVERLLTARGRRVDTCNFALPGYNAAQQAAALRRFGFAHEPDLVVVLSCENDHDPARVADADGWLRERRDGEDVRLAPPPLASRLARACGLDSSHLYLWLKLQWRRAAADRGEAKGRSVPWRWLDASAAGPATGELSPRLAEHVYPALAGIAADCRERGVPLVIATFAVAEDYQQMYTRLAAEFEVPVVHLLQLFADTHSYAELFASHSLGWDSHLDAAAHATWAAALVEVVDGQLPRRPR